MCPANSQISLGSRPVWSVMKKPWVLSYHKDSDQIGPRWSESSFGASCWSCHALAKKKKVKKSSSASLNVTLQILIYISWENLFLPYANNKGADQPTHARSLICAFVVRCLDSIIIGPVYKTNLVRTKSLSDHGPDQIWLCKRYLRYQNFGPDLSGTGSYAKTTVR